MSHHNHTDHPEPDFSSWVGNDPTQGEPLEEIRVDDDELPPLPTFAPTLRRTHAQMGTHETFSREGEYNRLHDASERIRRLPSGLNNPRPLPPANPPTNYNERLAQGGRLGGRRKRSSTRHYRRCASRKCRSKQMRRRKHISRRFTYRRQSRRHSRVKRH